jgi:hypothetical protein
MKPAQSVFLPVAIASFLIVAGVHAQAQKPTYKCDNNHYTDSLADPKAQGCKLLEGGNVTIVEGTRPQVVNTVGLTPNANLKVANASQASGQPGQRVDAGDQRARDSDSRMILEAELKKAEARKIELAREYNNGEPEKRGDETRNYQKYQERTAELKASLDRTDSDIAGIRRELGRAGGNSAGAASSGAK